MEQRRREEELAEKIRQMEDELLRREQQLAEATEDLQRIEER